MVTERNAVRRYTLAGLAHVELNGVEVSTVAHLGRRPTAHQRSALEVRDPECVVPSCHVRVGLEIDHVEPWSATRVTKLDALARLCRFHHAQKTHEGYRLEGGPGHWRWLKPDGTDMDPRPPPTRGRPPQLDCARTRRDHGRAPAVRREYLRQLHGGKRPSQGITLRGHEGSQSKTSWRV